MADLPSANQVKGVAVVASLRFLKERFGEEGLRETLASLSVADRDIRAAHVTCVHRGDPLCRFEGTWK